MKSNNKYDYANTNLNKIDNFNKFTIKGVEIIFSSDTWDFSQFYETEININNYKGRFYFKKIINEDYKIIEKLYIVNEILECDLNSSTILEHYNLINFLNFISINKIYNLESIDNKIVHKFINELNIKERSKQVYKRNILNFLYFYSNISGFQFSEQIITFLKISDTVKMNSEIESGKLSLLPFDFYHNFIKLLLEAAYSDKLSTEEKIVYSILYVCTQTGLRPSELLMLQNNSIEEKKIKNLSVYYLNYKSTKSIHGNGYEIVKTIINLETYKIFQNLDNLISSNNNGQKNITYLSEIPYEKFINIYKKFICNNAEFLGCISDAPDIEHYNSKAIKSKTGKYINIPALKQFRVYFYTELRRRGYSPQMVSILMNHHDEKMHDYYGRAVTDSIEEDLYYTKKVLNDVLVGDVNLLGPNAKAMANRLNSFVLNKNIKTAKNIEKIIEKIQGEMPCRSLNGGLCIKPNTTRTCEFETASDELACAYGYCPNQYHFVFNLKYYLDKFEECKKTYSYNKNNGYIQASEKEKYKIINLIKTKIIPEIEELKKEIELGHLNLIIKKYDYLIDIVEKIDEIELEIKKWTK